MPVFDPIEQRIAVRVVYDGVAHAGKTTNLRQLCMLFAAQRTELISPSDLRGRTLFFDWMQIMAGSVCGFPLICELVSVPGQVVLTPRRRHLLSTADVVVYVCESQESAFASARKGLELYDSVARERGAPIPLVIQANKQDAAGAMDSVSLLAALGRMDVPVIEGIASDGIGVVDTFVAAVRMVTRSLQSRADDGVLHVDVRRTDTASELLARVASERIDTEGAAELFLEEAAAAFIVENAISSVEADQELRSAAAAAVLELQASVLAPLDEPEGDAPITVRGGHAQPVSSAEGEAEVDRRADVAPPFFPSDDVPTGFVWPAHTARAVIRSLGLQGTLAKGFSAEGALEHKASGRIALTHRRERYADNESARNALVRRARECAQLGKLLASETVLVAQTASDGACWLWTVELDLPRLDAHLQTNAARDIVAQYGAAAVELLRASIRHGFTASFEPRNFGLENGSLRYVGDIVSEQPAEGTLSRSMFAAVEKLERLGADAHVLIDALESELGKTTVREARVLAALSVVEDWQRTDESPKSARRRLYTLLTNAHEIS